MNNVGISTACFYPENVLTSVSIASSFGFPVTEVFFNSFCESDRDNVRKIRSVADDNGTKIISYHPFTSSAEGLLFFSGYPNRVCDGLTLYQRFFESANLLGAKYVVFHGEKCMPTFSRRLLEEEELLSVYEQLADLAKREGLLLTQENVSAFRSSDPAFLRRLRDSLGDRIGFTFDVKQVLRAGRDLYETLDAMGDRLVHIHINDYGKKTECALPFCGEVDLKGLSDYLKQNDYRGDYVVEVYRSDFSEYEELVEACHKVRDMFCTRADSGTESKRKEFFTIDRFEGQFAVLETPAALFIRVGRELIPPFAKEGDILFAADGRYFVDDNETSKRKAHIRSALNRLFDK